MYAAKSHAFEWFYPMHAIRYRINQVRTVEIRVPNLAQLNDRPFTWLAIHSHAPFHVDSSFLSTGIPLNSLVDFGSKDLQSISEQHK